MSIHKYISLNQIISKYYRDFKIQDSDIWQDLIEWSAEAVQWIGLTTTARANLNRIFKVTNRQLCLPCDFLGNPQVAFNGRKVLPLEGTMVPIFTPTDFTDLLEAEIAISTLVTGVSSTSSNIDYRYWIDDCYMKFNFELNQITISYLGSRVDDKGFPLIPDIIEYKTALIAYFTKMRSYPDFISGKMSVTIWDKIEEDWDHRCMQARVEKIKPDLDDMEQIKNMWTRLIPNMNAATTFYHGMGAPDVPNTQ